MSGGGNPVKVLVDAVDLGLKDKGDQGFTQADIDRIYEAANQLFDSNIDLSMDDLNELSRKLSDLTDGKVNKGTVMKKLQGTSRADALRSVLANALN